MNALLLSLRLVACAAVLLAAMALWPPLPAAAQDTTVWSATLTVKPVGSSNRGCLDSRPGSECSTYLTRNTFTYNGVQYRVYGLFEFREGGAGQINIYLKTGDGQPIDATPLQDLTLSIDGTQYHAYPWVNQQAAMRGQIFRPALHPEWEIGDKVALRFIKKPQPTGKTFSLAGDTVREGRDALLVVTLGEDAPAGDVSFTVTPTYGSGAGKAQMSDVRTVPASVTVREGERRATITIRTADDQEDERDETFTVTIATNAAGWTKAGAGKDRATVRIRGNLPPLPPPPPPPPPPGNGGGGGFAPVVAPKFAEGARAQRTVAANAQPGDAVGDPVTAAIEDGGVVTYVLFRAEDAPVTMDPETGHLLVKEGAVLREGDTFTVLVGARSASGALGFIDVTITVTEAACYPYDANCNGVIELDEVLAAVQDYFDDRLSLEGVLEVVYLYFDG